MFQFHYTLTEDDYIKFNLNHMFHTKASKKTILILRFCPLFIFALTLLFLSDGTSFLSFIVEIIIFLIISIVWIALFKKLMLHNIKNTIRMTKKSGRLPYNEYGTLIFDENFIYDNTQAQEIKTAYNLIEAIYTTNDALYIYNSAMSAIILPYRCIENQTVFNNFVNFLQAKTNKTIINITK